MLFTLINTKLQSLKDDRELLNLFHKYGITTTRTYLSDLSELDYKATKLYQLLDKIQEKSITPSTLGEL